MLADEYLLEGQGELRAHRHPADPRPDRHAQRDAGAGAWPAATPCTPSSWPVTAARWTIWSAPAGWTGWPACGAARTCCRAASIAWWSAACRWAPCWRWPWRRSVPSTSPACWRCRRRFATTAGACRAIPSWPACCPSCARWASAGAACSWNNRPTASGRGAARPRGVADARRRQRRLGPAGQPLVVGGGNAQAGALGAAQHAGAARALPGHARAQRRHRLGVERLRDPAPGRQRARCNCWTTVIT